MEPIIKVDNVSMCFNLSTEKHESLKEYLLAMVQGRLQYDEFYALRDVSLDIMPGDFYGLVGLNGSGKSTLLKTIAGVYKPSKGKVTVNGTIAPLIELGAGFDMDLTARENIYLNGTVLGFSPKYLDEKFDEILVSHSIEQIERMCSKVAWLSHGHLKMNGDTETVCNAYKAVQRGEA